MNLGTVVSIRPSTVIAAAEAMEQAAPKYTELVRALRHIETSSMPADLAQYTASVLSCAAVEIAQQAANFAAKATALDKKMKRFIDFEEAAWSQPFGLALDVLDAHGGTFAQFVDSRTPKGTVLTLSTRLDLYAEYVGRPGSSTTRVGGRIAWKAVLTESSQYDSKIVMKYRRLYAEAAEAIVRKKNAKITVDSMHAKMVSIREGEIRLKLPDVPRIGKLARFGRLIPLVGAGVDGYVGYKQSSASDWKGRLASGGYNAAANTSIDAVPVAGQVYGVYDLALLGTGNSYWQAGSVVQVQSDGQVLAMFDDEQGLVLLLERIKAGQFGGLSKKMYKDYSDKEFARAMRRR